MCWPWIRRSAAKNWLSSGSTSGQHASKAICSSGWPPKWILWKPVESITDLFTLLVMTRSRVTWIVRKIQIISLIRADTTSGRPPSWKIWTKKNFCAGALVMPRRVLRHISQPISGFSALSLSNYCEQIRDKWRGAWLLINYQILLPNCLVSACDKKENLMLHQVSLRTFFHAPLQI